MDQTFYNSVLELRQVCEGLAQLSFIDLTVLDRKTKQRDKKVRLSVAETISELHSIHDRLNLQLTKYPSDRPVVQSPAAGAELIFPFLSMLDHEELWTMLLDVRNKVMNLVKVYQGSLTSSQVRIGEVFRQAVADNAAHILVFHNHPSGDPTPSPEDIVVTRSLVQAGKLLDIEVLDHIIIGSGFDFKFVSLKERGLGF
jgi:DNA repair protein RadC